MDPLSITAGIIGLLQVSGGIIYQCYEYRRVLKNRAKDAAELVNQLNSLRSVLEALLQIVDDDGASSDPRLPTIAAVAAPDGPLDICKSKLVGLQEKLEPKKGWKASLDHLLWPLKETEVQSVNLDISRMVGYLQLALSVDQTSSILAIQDGVSKIGEQLTSSKSDGEYRKITSWLDALDSAKMQYEKQKKCQPRTGKWFVKGDIIKKWKLKDTSLFWLHGIPGCGKSVLCSTLIQSLQEECKSSQDMALAYFYLDFGNSSYRSPEAVLKSLIAQLSEKVGNVPAELRSLFEEHEEGNRQPSESSLFQTLSQLITRFEAVYLVMDALDEGQNVNGLVQLLRNLRRLVLPQLHMLASSRELHEISQGLGRIITHDLRLHDSLIHADIAAYIRSRLQEDPTLSHFPIDMVQKALTTQAKGMFRWVDCQLSNLGNCYSLRDLERELHSLPQSLDETYEKILGQVPLVHRGHLMKILQWLAFSGRPVRIEELAEIIAVDAEDAMEYDPAARLIHPTYILKLGSSLITTSIVPVRHSKSYTSYDLYSVLETDVVKEVRLAHLSVKDYLLSDRIRSGRAADFGLDAKLSHSFMANTCLVYLLRSVFQGGYIKDRSRLKPVLEEWPLVHYAAHFWPHHINRAGEDMPEKTWQLVKRLFDSKKMSSCGNYGFWVFILVPTISLRGVESTTPLYYAASFGMVNVIKKLLTAGGTRVINETGGRFESTPLQVAAYRGQHDAVKTLLAAGADLSAWSFASGGSPLYLALWNGHDAIAGTLIDHGATLTETESMDYKSLLKRRSQRSGEFNAPSSQEGMKSKHQVKSTHNTSLGEPLSTAGSTTASSPSEKFRLAHRPR